ncbi:ShlB/FhaC/HecB family hemolysin secretion/activation protein [Sedimentisphaera salicampi]|nr:ShlB/FhaC/HecB family hemolysin secretion/activation protein [Sedimentisphaera salicampi]
MEQFKSQKPFLEERLEVQKENAKEQYEQKVKAEKASYKKKILAVKKRKEEAGVAGLGGLFVSGEKKKIKQRLDNEKKALEARHKKRLKELKDQYKNSLQQVKAVKKELSEKEKRLESSLRAAEKAEKAKQSDKSKAAVKDKGKQEADKKEKPADESEAPMPDSDEKLKAIEKQLIKKLEELSIKEEQIVKDLKEALHDAREDYEAKKESIRKNCSEQIAVLKKNLRKSEKAESPAEQEKLNTRIAALKIDRERQIKGLSSEYESEREEIRSKHEDRNESIKSQYAQVLEEYSDKYADAGGSEEYIEEKYSDQPVDKLKEVMARSEEKKISAQKKRLNQRRKETNRSIKNAYKANLADEERAYKDSLKKLEGNKEAIKKLKAEYENKKKQLKEKYLADLKASNLKYDYLIAEASVPSYLDYQSSDQKFKVEDFAIFGNEHIPDSELIENMPVIYSEKGEEEKHYDLTVFHKLLMKQSKSEQVSKAEIQGLIKYILEQYNKRYSGIFVYVPATEMNSQGGLKNNKLNINVIEGKVGESSSKYYNVDSETKTGLPEKKEDGHIDAEIVQSWSPAKKGELIKHNELNSFVQVLNQNPDLYVSPVVSRGDDPNTMNIEYQFYERRPWHILAQIDNSGSEERQWDPVIGLTTTNLTGRNDTATIFYQGGLFEEPSQAFKDNYSVFASYKFPFFTPYLQNRVYYGYSQFDSDSQAISDLLFRGEGEIYGTEFILNLFSAGEWMLDAKAGVSSEKSYINRVFGNSSIGIDTDIDLEMLGGGLVLYRDQGLNKTRVEVGVDYNYDGSSEEEFDKARRRAEPDFSILSVNFNHDQFFGESKIHRLKTDFEYIYSSDRLVSSKMSTFGGFNSVRGYEEDEIVADGGYNASLQYELDLLGFMNYRKDSEDEKVKSDKFSRIALAGFADYGKPDFVDPIAGEDDSQELFSAGLGAVWGFGENLEGEIYCGFPFEDTEETEKGDQRWSVRFIYRW